MTRSLALALIVAVSFTLAAAPARADKKADGIKAYKEGISLGNEGKLDEALAKWREAVGLYPELYVAHVKMGMAFEMQERLPQAAACYDLAVKAKKDAPEAWNSRGEFFAKQKVLDLAVADFRAAVELEKKDKGGKKKPEAARNLVKTLCLQEKFDEAEPALVDGLKAFKEDEDLLFYQGYLAMKRDKDVDAERSFRALEEKHPKSPMSAYGRGLLFKKVGDNENAKKAFGLACDKKHKPSCTAVKEIDRPRLGQ
jgi:tetratricopeptide (TPR) repeat protein